MQRRRRPPAWTSFFKIGLGVACINFPEAIAGANRRSGADDTVILSAEVVKDGKAVAIRMANGIKILDPAHGDTSFTGYDEPIIADDRTSAAWAEEAGMPISDASYPEPTAVWLFSRGRLIGGMGCGAGHPFSFRFISKGRKLVLACEFAHGPPSSHDVTFDTASGRCLSDRDLQTHRQQACEPDDFFAAKRLDK